MGNLIEAVSKEIAISPLKAKQNKHGRIVMIFFDALLLCLLLLWGTLFINFCQAIPNKVGPTTMSVQPLITLNNSSN